MTAEAPLAASLTVQAASGIFPVHSLPQVARKKQHGRCVDVKIRPSWQTVVWEVMNWSELTVPSPSSTGGSTWTC